MFWYKEKKRAMYSEIIKQAGGEGCTKEDIINVLFPDHGDGRSSGQFYIYWWDNPWETETKWWQRINRIWFTPLFVLVFMPIQYIFKGKVGFDERTKFGEIVLNLLGEK
jgi:hypothetical protein